MFLKDHITLVRRLAILLILYTFCRILFFLLNSKSFESAEISNVLLAFLYGIRFDASIIFSSNLLFIIISILPFAFINSKRWYQGSKLLFLVVNIPLLLMNLADIEYYKFTSKRTGSDILGIMGDVKNQSLQLMTHYWYIFLMIILFSFFVILFYGEYKIHEGVKMKKIYSWTLIPIIILFSILIIRGGFQYKPLKPDHAFVLSPNVLGNLVLNTPYNFFTTLSFPAVEDVHYYKTDNEAKLIIQQNDHIDTSRAKVNVVIIIMESFAREYMTKGNRFPGFTPFLDSLANESTYFGNHFANGKRSVEALPSIFASIPSLMEEPYITGVYQGNEIHGLAEAVNRVGYRTAFFHGGRNGTMGFDKFSLNAGFQEYYGLDEYPTAEKDFDGNWGIYDEPYFNYFCETISEFKPPFLASVFSLSSHQPYSVPAKYKDKFPKGYLEIHESVGYADHALRKFFEAASKKDWYSNTLFIITADHTQSLFTPRYNNIIGEYNVPLILFKPGVQIKADTASVSQHIDIMPTVLDFIGVNAPNKTLFGRSLLDSTIEGRVIYFSNKRYIYIKKDYFIEFDDSTVKLYALNDRKCKDELLDRPIIKKQYEKELKAYLQYYKNGLNKNDWYLKTF